MLKKNYFLIFGTAFTLILILTNCKNEKFWDISFSNILTCDIAIFITYFLTQYRQDNRIKIEKINGFIFDISNSINKIENINFDNTDFKPIFTMNIRKINNKLAILEKCKDKYKISEEVTYIKNEIEELNRFVSEKFNDVEYLKKSSITIKRHINNVDNKCDEIFSKLYL